MNPTTKKRLRILLRIFLPPVAAFEYIVLMWFWGGNGVFTLFAVPAFFAVFLTIQLLLRRKYTEKQRIRSALNYSMVFVTPILAVCCAYLLAAICGIPVVIW